MLGIQIRRLVKIEGKEPQYRMELAGTDAAQVDQTGDWRKIEFPNVGKLISQDAVRVSIAATAGKIIPKIKAKLWETIAQAMLDACIIEQGTEEMEWEGAARMYLQHYLSETGFIPCIEGQRLQDQRKPMVIEGKIAVCTSDFQIYVNKTTYQNLPVKAIAGMLSALGAKSIRVRGPKFKDQSRWVLPLSEFEPAEYQPTRRRQRRCRLIRATDRIHEIAEIGRRGPKKSRGIPYFRPPRARENHQPYPPDSTRGGSLRCGLGSRHVLLAHGRRGIGGPRLADRP